MIKYLLILFFILCTCTVFAKDITASWYGANHHGKKMSNGKIYNMNQLTCAASPKYKFGTRIRITNIANGKSVIVTVTDRGAFYKKREFDLSKKAFETIAPLKQGIVKIKFQIL